MKTIYDSVVRHSLAEAIPQEVYDRIASTKEGRDVTIFVFSSSGGEFKVDFDKIEKRIFGEDCIYSEEKLEIQTFPNNRLINTGTGQPRYLTEFPGWTSNNCDEIHETVGMFYGMCTSGVVQSVRQAIHMAEENRAYYVCVFVEDAKNFNRVTKKASRLAKQWLAKIVPFVTDFILVKLETETSLKLH